MAEVTNISAANTKFGIELFQRLSKEKKNENIFFSPFSISVALAMTQLGAREKTASEMAAALKWNVCDESIIHKEFQKYLSLLQTPTDKYQLSTANRIYVEESYPILEDFLNSTRDMYMAEAVSAKFKSAPDTERVAINTWVAEQTQDKIRDLLAQGVVDTLTRMVLVNAIYFKGKWEKQFKPQVTRPGPFKVSPSEVKQVPMMFASEKYAFTKDKELACTAVEIPYQGNELSMVILLPDQDFGLETLVSKLTDTNLNKLLGGLGAPMTKVDLTLPKFEMTSSFDLKAVLSAMGMQEAFSEASADFSGMTALKDLFVSAVVHKAFVKVNEEGTEAAAATSAVIGFRSLTMPVFVTVDHPFLFVIVDRRSANSVLFGGLVLDPPALDSLEDGGCQQSLQQVEQQSCQ